LPYKIVSIAELNSYLKEKLENDRLLRNIWVKGEISNFKHHGSGHMYFTLKDKESTIKAVMFRSYNFNLPCKPANGLSVLVRGSISVFVRDGQYQLYVEELHPEGHGVLSLAFEQLKYRLQEEGLFAPDKKKTIPVLPRKIGIVSSPAGAAIRDVLTVILRRFPKLNILIYPTQVQGDQAPGQIVKAIDSLGKIEDLDVIIIARGGGSFEELAAFNTEEVARAISRCSIPIITGIGHETDFTIADFVADLRAATPSAAAELAVPVKQEILQHLSQLKQRLERTPRNYLNQRRQVVDSFEQELLAAAKNMLKDCSAEVKLAAEKLNLLSPLNILARGYSICRAVQSKEVIASAKQTSLGQQIEVLLSIQEKLICQVQEIKIQEIKEEEDECGEKSCQA
jgi:exodeoxyribonuclease VII large subunit